MERGARELASLAPAVRQASSSLSPQGDPGWKVPFSSILRMKKRGVTSRARRWQFWDLKADPLDLQSQIASGAVHGSSEMHGSRVTLLASSIFCSQQVSPHRCLPHLEALWALSGG